MAEEQQGQGFEMLEAPSIFESEILYLGTPGPPPASTYMPDSSISPPPPRRGGGGEIDGSGGAWLSIEIMSETSGPHLRDTFIQMALLDIVSIDVVSTSLYAHARDELSSGAFDYNKPPGEIPADSPFSQLDTLHENYVAKQRLLEVIKNHAIHLDSRRSHQSATSSSYQSLLSHYIVAAEHSLDLAIMSIQWALHHRGLRMHRERLEKAAKAKEQASSNVVKEEGPQEEPPCLICCREKRRKTTLRRCFHCSKMLCVTCISKLESFSCPFCLRSWEED